MVMGLMIVYLTYTNGDGSYDCVFDLHQWVMGLMIVYLTYTNGDGSYDCVFDLHQW